MKKVYYQSSNNTPEFNQNRKTSPERFTSKLNPDAKEFNPFGNVKKLSLEDIEDKLRTYLNDMTIDPGTFSERALTIYTLIRCQPDILQHLLRLIISYMNGSQSCLYCGAKILNYLINELPITQSQNLMNILENEIGNMYDSTINLDVNQKENVKKIIDLTYLIAELFCRIEPIKGKPIKVKNPMFYEALMELLEKMMVPPYIEDFLINSTKILKLSGHEITQFEEQTKPPPDGNTPFRPSRFNNYMAKVRELVLSEGMIQRKSKEFLLMLYCLKERHWDVEDKNEIAAPKLTPNVIFNSNAVNYQIYKDYTSDSVSPNGFGVNMDQIKYLEAQQMRSLNNYTDEHESLNAIEDDLIEYEVLNSTHNLAAEEEEFIEHQTNELERAKHTVLPNEHLNNTPDFETPSEDMQGLPSIYTTPIGDPLELTTIPIHSMNEEEDADYQKFQTQVVKNVDDHF